MVHSNFIKWRLHNGSLPRIKFIELNYIFARFVSKLCN